MRKNHDHLQGVVRRARAKRWEYLGLSTEDYQHALKSATHPSHNEAYKYWRSWIRYMGMTTSLGSYPGVQPVVLPTRVFCTVEVTL